MELPKPFVIFDCDLVADVPEHFSDHIWLKCQGWCRLCRIYWTLLYKYALQKFDVHFRKLVPLPFPPPSSTLIVFAWLVKKMLWVLWLPVCFLWKPDGSIHMWHPLFVQLLFPTSNSYGMEFPWSSWWTVDMLPVHGEGICIPAVIGCTVAMPIPEALTVRGDFSW